MQAGTRPELSQSQRCTGRLGGPARDGAPQGLTSQLRSLSLVTVRSAKSPRLTSPPPIVSMMKTSEEKPKEPGRGRGGRGPRRAGRERERQREAERGEKGDREAGRGQDQESQLERKKKGESDRQTGQDRQKERETEIDRRTFGTGRLQTRERLGLDPEDTEARGLVSAASLCCGALRTGPGCRGCLPSWGRGWGVPGGGPVTLGGSPSTSRRSAKIP